MDELKAYINDDVGNIFSVPIKNEVINITSEHSYSEGFFTRKFQAKIYLSGQSFEKQEE